jgi:PAS domain S-box-containing protein
MEALSRSTGLVQALEACYRAAIRVSGMDCGGIYLLEPDGSLVLAFHNGLSDAFLRVNEVVSPEDPRAGLVRAGQSLYTSMQQIRAQTGRTDPEETAEGLKALAVVPIVFDGEAVGCINLASHVFDELPQHCRGVLEVLAGQIAQSLLREMATAKLSEREENLNTLFDNVDDLLFVLDEDGQVLKVNAAVTRLLGYTEADLSGKPMGRIHPESRRKAANEALLEARSTRSLTYDVPLLRRDGSVVPVQTRVTHGRWNGASAFFCVARDLSPQQNADAERRRLERQLFESQKLESLGVMAGGIAHDFNNILVSVLGNATVALAEGCENSRIGRHLRDIIAGSERAAALCRQMLAYLGRGRFLIESLDLSAQVRSLQALIGAPGTRPNPVSYELPAGLEPIEGDAAQVGQVVMNLVINALEALGNGRGSVRVSTGEGSLSDADLANMLAPNATPGRFTYVEVSDDGVGMDSETVDKVFDPFFTKKPTGHGLGMSAVLGIVRGHNAALSLHTVLGEGTTFRVYFPVSASKARTDAPTRVDQSCSPTISSTRVLLVDDDPTVLELVSIILKRAGAEVVSVGSGEEALAEFDRRNCDFDLVLLDLTMPRLDGASTFVRLASRDPTVPVIIMSGYTEDELSLKLEGHTPAAFLGKPFRSTTLVEAVAEHARRRARRAMPLA